MTSRVHWFGGITVLTVLSIAVYWFSSSDNHPTMSHQTASPQMLPPTLTPATTSSSIYPVDASGNLRINFALRQHLEASFPMNQPQTWDQMQKRLMIEIHTQLHGSAAIQAEKLLNSYLNLQKALLTQHLDQPDAAFNIEQASQELTHIQQLRKQYLSPEVINTFYAEQDKHDQYLIDQSQIMQNPALSNEEKSQQIHALQMQTGMNHPQP